MRGNIFWHKTIHCQNIKNAEIVVHITQSAQKQLERMDRRVSYINPNRIGIDFDNFNYESHGYIPNLSIADIVQLINRLDLLEKDFVRAAIENKVISHGFGVELDSRRKIDFDVRRDTKLNREEILIEYEDPLRNIETFEIGRICVDDITLFVRALKEAYIEYNHIMNKALILGDFV